MANLSTDLSKSPARKIAIAVLCALSAVAGLGAAPSASAAPAKSATAAKATSATKSSTGSKATSTLKGWTLAQQCPFSNAYTISLTPEALRIDHRTGDWYIIAKAPDWRVYVIRPKDKIIASVEHQYWLDKVHLRNGSWTSQLEKPIKTVHSITADDKRITYTFGKAVAANSAELMFRDKQTPNEGNNHSEIVCIVYPNGNKSGPIIGRLQNLPPVDGIPYSAARFFDSGIVNGAIRTNNLQRNVTFSPEIFKLPTGLKEVTFERKLVISSAQQQNSEDLLREFMAK